MATSKKKIKPTAKATAARKPAPKKAASARKPASRPGTTKSSLRPTAAKSSSSRTPEPAPSPREKLSILRPSGQKEDSFFELVHEVARQIPRGRVTSYGAIAAALGTRLSARMVGWAMNACHLSKKPVPAHRVVNSLGLLTGRHHFQPPEKMQQLLEKEGITIKNDKIVDFKKHFWDPAQEM